MNPFCLTSWELKGIESTGNLKGIYHFLKVYVYVFFWASGISCGVERESINVGQLDWRFRESIPGVKEIDQFSPGFDWNLSLGLRGIYHSWICVGIFCQGTYSHMEEIALGRGKNNFLGTLKKNRHWRVSTEIMAQCLP